jgi:hypothetical protein
MIFRGIAHMVKSIEGRRPTNAARRRAIRKHISMLTKPVIPGRGERSARLSAAQALIRMKATSKEVDPKKLIPLFTTNVFYHPHKQIIKLLVMQQATQAIPALAKVAKCSTGYNFDQMDAALAIGKLGGSSAYSTLAGLFVWYHKTYPKIWTKLKGNCMDVSSSLLRGLALLKSKRALSFIGGIVASRSYPEDVRLTGISILGQLGGISERAILVKALPTVKSGYAWRQVQFAIIRIEKRLGMKLSCPGIPRSLCRRINR